MDENLLKNHEILLGNTEKIQQIKKSLKKIS